MPITVKPSENWPERVDVTHWHYPEANISTTIALTEADVANLIIDLEDWQDWQDKRRRERDGG